MSEVTITDTAKLIEQLSRFISFVEYKDGHNGPISFRDGNRFLGKEEDFKSKIAEKARKALNCNNWKESWIGSGKIALCAKQAMNQSWILVNSHAQIAFKDCLDENHEDFKPEAERVLFDIYCNTECDEATAFKKAAETFGAKYNTISYLFFIKDDSRFLPIKPEYFDKGFEALGIDYHTSRCCNWDNYMGFIGLMKQIRKIMEDMLPMEGTPRLIDAHSFVWVTQEKAFQDWNPDNTVLTQIEQTAEDYIQRVVTGTGGQRETTTNVFVRSAEVVKATKERANGICQYCGQPAPFADKNGNPYLETHHIIWLSRGCEDSTSNTVALCPNCHSRMHVLDKPEDIELLLRIANPAN